MTVSDHQMTALMKAPPVGHYEVLRPAVCRLQQCLYGADVFWVWKWRWSCSMISTFCQFVQHPDGTLFQERQTEHLEVSDDIFYLNDKHTLIFYAPAQVLSYSWHFYTNTHLTCFSVSVTDAAEERYKQLMKAFTLYHVVSNCFSFIRADTKQCYLTFLTWKHQKKNLKSRIVIMDRDSHTQEQNY